MRSNPVGIANPRVAKLTYTASLAAGALTRGAIDGSFTARKDGGGVLTLTLFLSLKKGKDDLTSLVTQVISLKTDQYSFLKKGPTIWELRLNENIKAVGTLNPNAASSVFSNFSGSVTLTGIKSIASLKGPGDVAVAANPEIVVASQFGAPIGGVGGVVLYVYVA